MVAMKTVARWCVHNDERWPTVGGGSDVLLHQVQRKGEVSDNSISRREAHEVELTEERQWRRRLGGNLATTVAFDD
jgi:hypothetical protein